MQLPIAQPDEEHRLDQENSAPFSAPDDVDGALDDDHQVADANVDTQEWYDEGLSSIVENKKSPSTTDYRYQSDKEWNSKHGPVIVVRTPYNAK